jgi:hypothetical protein
MVCNLAKYLVDNGVPKRSIVIITPYKGQLMLIRKDLMNAPYKLIDRNNDSIRISTVDQFQGDEADIVIVSLVIDGRSTTPFVKLQNRMIVLLSVCISWGIFHTSKRIQYHIGRSQLNYFKRHLCTLKSIRLLTRMSWAWNRHV